MSYTTKQEMIDEFGESELVQLTDLSDPPAGAIDDVRLTRALEAADDTINGYLAGRYALPFASPPAILGQLARDLARYRLYKDHPSDEVAARNDKATKFLQLCAAGTVGLGVSAAGVEAAPADTVQFTPGQKVFGREDL
jgi:phage gp36-like protein